MTTATSRCVTGKLGNMRKPVVWVLYPERAEGQRVAIIQSDKRIAAVNLDTGDTVLSDGKGGHPSFQKLNPLLGATKCICPSELLEQLRGTARLAAAVLVLSDANHEVLWEQIDLEDSDG